MGKGASPVLHEIKTAPDQEQPGRPTNDQEKPGLFRQVVCLSTSNYDAVPTRKQNVMNRLVDADILYFDPGVTWIAPLKDPTAKARLAAWKQPGRQVTDNIRVFAIPPYLPFFNRYRVINRSNQRRLAAYVRRRMKEHGFEKPLLWCYSPTSCDLVDLIPRRGLVYDCVDRHSAYPGMIDPAVVDRMEQDLASRADQVFCTAAGLYDRLADYNSNTVLIPNGANFDLFVQAAGRTLRPERFDRPVFGFVGMLQDCLDYNAIMAVAQAWPEGEVRLIGKPLPGVDLSPLQQYPNIKLLGLKPQAELPALMREFDVCLNVFRAGDLSRDVSPLKFYEYLATGKPVVSTPEPLQVADFSDVVYIASHTDDFVVKCRQALTETDPAIADRRIAYARDCSWDSRVAQMVGILKERELY